MTDVRTLLPGDIMFAMHVRPRSVDLLILAGQLTLGHPGYPHHVGVVTQARTSYDPALLVQAMPGGAEEVEIDNRFLGTEVMFLRPQYSLDGGYGTAHAARIYIDTPYSYLDYVALAGARLGIKDGPVRHYVTTSKHMICSQLADQSMSDAGYHVFNDGRLPQDVVPSDLHGELLRQGARLL